MEDLLPSVGIKVVRGSEKAVMSLYIKFILQFIDKNKKNNNNNNNIIITA